jgi:hypothetical protein
MEQMVLVCPSRALATGWVQPRFWKEMRRMKTLTP